MKVQEKGGPLDEANGEFRTFCESITKN
jgi:hypothetical protein